MKHLLFALALLTSASSLQAQPCNLYINQYPANDGFEYPGNFWGTIYSTSDINWYKTTETNDNTPYSPNSAHGGSKYMRLLAASNSTPNGVGYLDAFCLDVSNVDQFGLRFQYYANGPRITSLGIEVSTNNGISWTRVWTTTGVRDQQWHQVYSDLTPYIGPERLRLRLVGQTGSQGAGLLAVDDVEIIAHTISPPTYCGSSSDWNSFESGFDGWGQAPNDDLQWSRRSGATPSHNTGPSSAFDGNQYLYVESSSPNYGGKDAIIYGPCRNMVGNWEVRFKYHLYGSDMGTLRFQKRTNGGNWSTIWSRTGDQGNSWKSATLPLSNNNSQQVEFRFWATTGNGYQSDMAIDQFEILFIGFNNGGSGGDDDGFGDPQKPRSTLALDEAATLSVAPNPFYNQLVIQTTLENVQGYRLTNLQGRLLQEGNMPYKTILVQDLPQGIYFLTVYNDHQKLVQKVVKQ